MLKKAMAKTKLAVAIRYWHCARIILSNQSRPVAFFEPVGLLLGMSAELSLKAFAKNAGMSEKQLSNNNIVGHDLGKALCVCIKHGLELGKEDAELILTMRISHLNHFYRYGFPESQGGVGAILLTDENFSLKSIARIIDIVGDEPKLLRKWDHKSEELNWPNTIPPLFPIKFGEAQTMMRAIESRAEQIKKIGMKS